MQLAIRWWRDTRYPDTAAHATVPIIHSKPLRPGEDVRDTVIGSMSPVCMHENASIGDARAHWVETPYAKRCAECVAALTRALEEAITVPTAPVVVRFVVDVTVAPDKVDHAHDLMRNYLARTKTFQKTEMSSITIPEDRQ